MAKGIFQIHDQVHLAISEGLVKDVKHIGKFGYNSNLATGVEALLWPGPTAMYVFPDDNGEAMELVSTNVADTQTVLVQALDANWDEVSLPLVLTGTTPVALPIPVARINRLINIDSTDTLGDFIVQGAGGGVVFAVALQMEQITTQLVVSIPRGFKAKLETSLITLNKSGGSDSGAIFRYRRRPFGGVFGTGARFGLNKQGTTAVVFTVENVTPLDPKTDVILVALADANGTDVSARLPFTLYKV